MGFNTSEAPEQAVAVLEGMSFEVRCNKDGQPSLWAPSSRQILPQKLTQTANSGSSILLASHLHNSSTKTTSIWPWAISWPQTLWMIFTLTMFKFRAQKLEIQCNYFTRCKAQQYVQYIRAPPNPLGNKSPLEVISWQQITKKEIEMLSTAHIPNHSLSYGWDVNCKILNIQIPREGMLDVLPSSFSCCNLKSMNTHSLHILLHIQTRGPLTLLEAAPVSIFGWAAMMTDMVRSGTCLPHLAVLSPRCTVKLELPPHGSHIPPPLYRLRSFSFSLGREREDDPRVQDPARNFSLSPCRAAQSQRD